MSKEKNVRQFKKSIDKITDAKLTNAVIELSIANISEPKFHDRNSIDDEKIFDLANNIREVGLVNPVIVRKTGEGKYERIAGYRRIEAYKKLNLDKIPAIVIEADEKEAMMLMISENLQRENLNTFDEVCSVLHLISLNIGMTEEEVEAFLGRISNQENGKLKASFSFEEKDTKNAIIELLDKIGKYNLFTFVAKMRVLHLNPLLVDAIKKQQMPYSIALVHNKIKDDEKLKELIKEYIVNKPSLQDVKDTIHYILGDTQKPNPLAPITKGIKKFYTLPAEKQSEIQQKIIEIQSLLAG